MTVFSEDVYDLLDAQILHLEPTPKPLTYQTLILAFTPWCEILYESLIVIIFTMGNISIM